MRHLFTAVLASTILATPSHAAVQVFTDRSAFDAAIINMTNGVFSTSKGAVNKVYSYSPVTFDFKKVGDSDVLSDGNFSNVTYLAASAGTASISSTTTALGFNIGSLDLQKALKYNFNGTQGTFSLSSQSDKTTAFLGFVDTGAISGTFDFGLNEYDIISYVTGSIRPVAHAPSDAATSPGAVPEPASWAMMLVGFGMVGAVARYRRLGMKASFA